MYCTQWRTRYKYTRYLTEKFLAFFLMEVNKE